jgi:hypothetical protein
VKRKERGEGSEEQGRGTKGRILQDRDRLALWLVGTNRVLRERTVSRALFPGRDASTSRNRVSELARPLRPVGAYWNVFRRSLEDGVIERYLGLTDVGYRQATLAASPTWFERRPVELLKPSHIEHDLELADFAVSLLPTTIEMYQPTVRGRPAGPAAQVEVPHVPKMWRWRHASVCRRLTVFAGKKDASGRWIEKPRVACAFEPDAILETDTLNCTRYFIEWDRGTEPVSGRETRTIEDKFKRIRAYFWTPRSVLDPGRHWSMRGSYYLEAFRGKDLRRPKVLLITRSSKRARNIWRIANLVFDELGDDLEDFLEVKTIHEAQSKLRSVLQHVETSALPKEMPWVTQLRSEATVAAARQAVAARAARDAELRDPLFVPYAVRQLGEPAAGPCKLATNEARQLVTWFDEIASAGVSRRPASALPSAVDELGDAVHQSLGSRMMRAVGLGAPADATVMLGWDSARRILREADAAFARDPAIRPPPGSAVALRILSRILLHFRSSPREVPALIIAVRAAWNNDAASPWREADEYLRRGRALIEPQTVAPT